MPEPTSHPQSAVTDKDDDRFKTDIKVNEKQEKQANRDDRQQLTIEATNDTGNAPHRDKNPNLIDVRYQEIEGKARNDREYKADAWTPLTEENAEAGKRQFAHIRATVQEEEGKTKSGSVTIAITSPDKGGGEQNLVTVDDGEFAMTFIDTMGQLLQENLSKKEQKMLAAAQKDIIGYAEGGIDDAEKQKIITSLQGIAEKSRGRG